MVGSNVPPCTIAAGNPVREIRKRFDEELTSLIPDFRWWDKSISEINQLIPLLTCGDQEEVKEPLASLQRQQKQKKEAK